MAILRHWTLIAACYALVTHYAVGASSHRHDKTSDMDADVTYMYIVVSAAVIVTSITIIAMCNWCYGQKYSPYDDTSGITQNEMVVGNSYIDIGDLSALNVDSLESNDPIRIEPLPDVSVRTHKPNSTGSLSTVSGYLSHLQLPRTQLNYVAEIGSGWFGKVLTGEAHKLQTGLKKTKVIIKQLKDDATSDEKNQFLLEVQPYRELKHTNILSLVGQCTENMPYLVIMEFCAFGDVKGFLLRRRSEATTLSQSGVLIGMACGIANGLEYMHRANMVHNDLSARNCVVSVDMTVKIGDYGISQHRYKNDYYNSCHDIKLPIRWMAPETLDCQGVWVVPKESSMSKPANVWSFGVILWELLEFGRQPYDALDDSAVLKKVIVEQNVKLRQPVLDVAFADRWFEIMLFCWLFPEQRPIMAEICALLKHLKLQSSVIKESMAAENEGSLFDDKWNAIRPKQTPSIVDSEKFEPDFTPKSNNISKIDSGFSRIDTSGFAENASFADDLSKNTLSSQHNTIGSNNISPGFASMTNNQSVTPRSAPAATPPTTPNTNLGQNSFSIFEETIPMAEIKHANPNTNHIKITAQVHMNNDSIVSDQQNNTVGENANTNMVETKTTTIVQRDVPESPKQNTVIMTRMPSELNGSDDNEVVVVDSANLTHIQPSVVTEVILTDEDTSVSISSEGKSLPSDLTTINIDTGDDDNVTCAIVGYQNDDVSQPVSRRNIKKRNRTFQIIEVNNDTEIHSTDNVPIIATTEGSDGEDMVMAQEEEVTDQAGDYKKTVTFDHESNFSESAGDALINNSLSQKNENATNADTRDEEDVEFDLGLG